MGDPGLCSYSIATEWSTSVAVDIHSHLLTKGRARSWSCSWWKIGWGTSRPRVCRSRWACIQHWMLCHAHSIVTRGTMTFPTRKSRLQWPQLIRNLSNHFPLVGNNWSPFFLFRSFDIQNKTVQSWGNGTIWLHFPLLIHWCFNISPLDLLPIVRQASAPQLNGHSNRLCHCEVWMLWSFHRCRPFSDVGLVTFWASKGFQF